MTRTYVLVLLLLLAGCSGPAEEHAEAEETEALSRTEFTVRVENFFEYAPLKAGQTSQFLIHLTDLSDGKPVEKATVTLKIRAKGSESVVSEVTSRIGRVNGIYVADVSVPRAGDYDIEFHIKNDKLDERLPLTDFKVE